MNSVRSRSSVAGVRTEPEQLRRGKAFQRVVQRDWLDGAEGSPLVEHTIRLLAASDRFERRRIGRIDVFVADAGDLAVIVEIKATNWDRIKPRNIQRNLASHRRQVWKYIEKYVDGDGVDVCAGIIYPSEPKSEGLKERVESYLNGHGLQVVWFYD